MPVLNETDVYRELPVPRPLRRSIACLWIRRGDGGAVRILPDACTDIVWRPGAGAFVAGPDTRGRLSSTRPGETIVGARFRPGAGGSALGWPLHELRDRRVPLSELGLGVAEEMEEAPDPAAALALVAAAAFRLAGGGAPDGAVQAAVRGLRDPARRIERLAGDLGLSQRQLHRRFLAAVGYGPKTLQRVLRLRGFLATSAADVDSTLARAAFDAGYADQAHLARECRDLTGLTPRELLGAMPPRSNDDEPPWSGS
jgi:AraC-like DNA-binding protein